jgi:hypothetical protein
MPYRVTLFLTCWLALWTAIGLGIGFVFRTPMTGMIDGFIFAVLSTFLWPWIVPNFLDDWMDGQTA